MNAGVKVLIAIAVGLCMGILLHAVCPTAIQKLLIEDYLQPLYDFWIRMLTVLSGPVILLMVCTSVLNTRTIEEEGGDSRMVFMRYFLLSLAAALIAVLVSGVVLHGILQYTGRKGFEIAGYWKAILSVMPENAVKPLMESNTPQILLLAFAVGSGIVMLGWCARETRSGW